MSRESVFTSFASTIILKHNLLNIFLSAFDVVYVLLCYLPYMARRIRFLLHCFKNPELNTTLMQIDYFVRKQNMEKIKSMELFNL